MMDTNFYVKSMRSFIILSVYVILDSYPNVNLLHTDPSEFKELGKTHQVTCFLLSTLNH